MTDQDHAVPVIFGEVLFDCFPDGNSVLGGAPFNVAWHLQAFGMSPMVVSSIGDDELGQNVKSAMLDWGMGVSGLQLDPSHPTGSVAIEFNNGEPQYTIVEHRAYDYIDAGSLPPLPRNRLLYHGSLALRNQASRDALSGLKQQHSDTVFDADWVKLNEDELAQLGNGTGDIESQAREFLGTHKLKGLVVTLGAKGAIALTDNGAHAEVTPSQTLEVVDTVGAGDAFTSVLILGIILQWPLEQTMQRAQQFASLMVGQQGATVHDHGFYRPMITDWCL
jgi:fructokinase